VQFVQPPNVDPGPASRQHDVSPKLNCAATGLTGAVDPEGELVTFQCVARIHCHYTRDDFHPDRSDCWIVTRRLTADYQVPPSFMLASVAMPQTFPAARTRLHLPEQSDVRLPSPFVRNISSVWRMNVITKPGESALHGRIGDGS